MSSIYDGISVNWKRSTTKGNFMLYPLTIYLRKRRKSENIYRSLNLLNYKRYKKHT